NYKKASAPRRRPGSSRMYWIPAFAGMTAYCVLNFVVPLKAQAANTYYIDYTGGADTNDGLQITSDGQGHGPWKHAPGMAGQTGNPLTIDTNWGDYSGYSFIFKGGVRWDHNALPWTIREHGTSGP